MNIRSRKHPAVVHRWKDETAQESLALSSWQTDGQRFTLGVKFSDRRYLFDLSREEAHTLTMQMQQALLGTENEHERAEEF